MDEILIPSGRGDDNLFQRVVAHYDAPAYVRRALRVQEQYDGLLASCRRQREEWLPGTRTALGLLRAHAGAWNALLPWLDNEDQLCVLEDLWAQLQPKLRICIKPSNRMTVLQRSLRTLVECIGRFNDKWNDYLQKLDLTGMNAEREAYNHYYLLEKECAMRSARLARIGFQRLSPLTAAELAVVLPLLPVPRLRASEHQDRP